MSERMVEIPVKREVRDKIKEAKSGLTYSEFLGLIIKQWNPEKFSIVQ
jgi:hypothetical protein